MFKKTITSSVNINTMLNIRVHVFQLIQVEYLSMKVPNYNHNLVRAPHVKRLMVCDATHISIINTLAYIKLLHSVPKLMPNKTRHTITFNMVCTRFKLTNLLWLLF